MNVDALTAIREARRSIDQAERENRDLTEAEQKKVDRALDRGLLAHREAEFTKIDRPVIAAPEGKGGFGNEANQPEGLGTWLLESKALAEGSGSGSYIVPEEWRPQVWDRLAAQSVGLVSGFTVIETVRDTLHVPRNTSDATADFFAEAATITATDPGLNEVIATPRKLAARTVFSNELRDDSTPEVIAFLAENLTRSLALRLDKAFFLGTGTAPEIRGLKNVSGIQEHSMGTNGGALTTLDPFAEAFGLLEAENATATAIVMTPRDWKAVLKLKETSTSNKPLVQEEAGGPTAKPRRSIYGVPVYLSSQLPVDEVQGSASNASSAYVYQANQVVAVRRADVRVEVDSSRLFDSDQSEMRAICRWDVVLPNVKAVVRVKGIIP